MAPHTPGPYRFEPIPEAARDDPDMGIELSDLFWIVDTRHASEVLATVHETKDREGEANAILFAKAPEMLAALKRVLPVLDAWSLKGFATDVRDDVRALVAAVPALKVF
jgi:hypothetical protein